MTIRIASVALGFAWLVLAGCASVRGFDNAPDGALCANTGLRVYADFSGANAERCAISGRKVTVVVQPESTPVNSAAWYAFRVEATEAEEVKLVLRYPGFAHRYPPKTSIDGETWTRIPPERVAVSSNGETAWFMLSVEAHKPIYISGQELITVADYEAWVERLRAVHPFLEQRRFGRSPDGHDLMSFYAPAERPQGTLVLVGRQHPPEISGAVGLFAFVDTVLGDSELARAFRKKYSIALAPLLNPDGVERGHWRLNTGGVDLNRDWGPFTQPETRAIRDELERLDTIAPIALFLDFHSTRKTVFYAQADDAVTRPADFSARLKEAINARGAPIPFTRQPGPDDGKTTSKAYMFNIYGVAATTFELYEEEDRDAIRVFAEIVAEETMKILLADDSGARVEAGE